MLGVSRYGPGLGKMTYQSIGIGPINAVQSHGRLDVLCSCGIGPDAVQDDRATEGIELIGGGTQARADSLRRQHG